MTGQTLLFSPHIAGSGHCQVEGTIGTTVEEVAVNTTLDETNSVELVDASGGAITITLPAAANVTNRHYWIKKIDSSGNSVTVDGNGAETIDGSATAILSVQYDAIHIVCDGTGWHIT
jgi:hypothetical protein